MKVAINACFGGFSLSPKAALWMWERGAKDMTYDADTYFSDATEWRSKDKALAEWREFQANPGKRAPMFLDVFSPDEKLVIRTHYDGDRHDPLLIECIETLGKEANGGCASIKIVEIPDGMEYEIAEYDGNEHVAQVHQTWS